jgi:hypothetical protein
MDSQDVLFRAWRAIIVVLPHKKFKKLGFGRRSCFGSYKLVKYMTLCRCNCFQHLRLRLSLAMICVLSSRWFLVPVGNRSETPRDHSADAGRVARSRVSVSVLLSAAQVPVG